MSRKAIHAPARTNPLIMKAIVVDTSVKPRCRFDTFTCPASLLKAGCAFISGSFRFLSNDWFVC
jgi:hypothetical protein